MKTNKTLTYGLLAFVLSMGVAKATDLPKTEQQAEQRIDDRESKQQERIDAGVKSGAISSEEAARLQKQQARIESVEAKADADGKLTKQEAKRIEKMQDRASKRIHRKKHN